jgi:hypothetical protein
LQVTVPLGHSQLHVATLRPWPLVQLATHCPLHSVVADGHSHRQLVGDRSLPPEHWFDVQTPLQSTLPAPQSHMQVAGLRVAPPPQVSTMQSPLAHVMVPDGHWHGLVLQNAPS